MTSEDVCCICLDHMQRNNTVRLHCDHVMHNTCLYSWMQFKQECPYCRAGMDVLDMVKVHNTHHQQWLIQMCRMPMPCQLDIVNAMNNMLLNYETLMYQPWDDDPVPPLVEEEDFIPIPADAT